jgi:hypothetical protein
VTAPSSEGAAPTFPHDTVLGAALADAMLAALQRLEQLANEQRDERLRVAELLLSHETLERLAFVQHAERVVARKREAADLVLTFGRVLLQLTPPAAAAGLPGPMSAEPPRAL